MYLQKKCKSTTEVLILADDFTGALDTAVQLTGYGKKIRVIDAEKSLLSSEVAKDEVLVFNTDTRHCDPKQAYEKILHLTKRAAKSGVRCIYKKTDSVLRGNIGAELAGVMEGSGRKKTFFVPAFPKMERTTRNGIQRWKGIPIHETAFGQDPFEPLSTSVVSEILAEQGLYSCTSVPISTAIPETPASCIVFDAESDADLGKITEQLKGSVDSCVLAGCAGFAAWLPQLLGWHRVETKIPLCADQLLIVSGSVHPVTAEQLKYAQENALPIFYLDPLKANEQEQRDLLVACIENCFKETRQACLAVPAKSLTPFESGARETISACLADITRQVIENNNRTLLMVNGGDTLLNVLRMLGSRCVSPVCEIFPGIVFSYADTDFGLLTVVTKSGGFGDENVLIKIKEGLRQCV